MAHAIHLLNEIAQNLGFGLPIFCNRLASLSPSLTSSVDERIEFVSRANIFAEIKIETIPNNKYFIYLTNCY